MKKIFSVFMALFAAFVSISAQNSNEKMIINFKFDYSQMIIDKMEAIGFVAVNENEGNDTPDIAFQKFTQKLEAAFISATNGHLLQKTNFRLDNGTESQYLLKISFGKVDKDGEHTVNCSLMDCKQEKCITTFSAHADGGNWGTFMNLFVTDAVPVSGKKTAKKLISFLKKLPQNVQEAHIE